MKITNPLPIKNIGDPYIIKSKETFYLYATSDFNGFYCWHSPDLKEWSEPVVCYEATEKSFGNACFWAPEIYEFEGKFFMYYTAQWKKFTKEELRIGVAVADNPLGPFIDVHDEAPMFDFGYGCLDAHVLDDGGKKYLYYSRAGEDHIVDGNKQSEIFVVEMGSDNVTVKGEGKLILAPEQAWELAQPEKKQFWNEGPFVIKHKNSYHLMYSANYFGSEHYGIGVAVSDHPEGPFEKYSNNPILHTTASLSGPGHNSVVAGAENQLYCVFHAHTDYVKKGGDRQVYIEPLCFDDEKIRIATEDLVLSR